MKTLALVATVALLFALSLLAGKVWLTPAQLLDGGPASVILLELRLPRALLGALVGAALGLSGAALQGYLRNPLADPSVVGVAATAALGAVIAIFLGFAASPALVFTSAMTGAALAVVLLILIAGSSGSPVTFILAGSVLSSLAGALTAFLLSIAPDPFAANEILGWLMGALTDRGLDDVVRAAPPVLLGLALLATNARALDALTLGEEGAASLGIDLARLRLVMVAGLCLTVGAAVAATGVVGFVGLVVPHLMRRAFGERPSALFLPSALGGAALVLAADSLVRLTPGPSEVQLGIATATIGSPFFFALLLKLRRTLP